LTHWEKGQAECKFTVQRGAPFVVAGCLEVPFMLEHMAQTVAACLGYEAFLEGEGVRVGMIIACRAFEAHQLRISQGTTITIRVNRIRGNDTLSHFDCQAHCTDATVATAQLTLYHGATPPEFSKV